MRAFDLLASGDADVAVVVATPGIPAHSDPAFDQRPFYTEPLDVVVGPHHPLAGHGSITLQDVAADPWIVGTPGRAYHQLVLVACTSAGFRPTVAHYADEWDTGAALVSAGAGVAMVPRLADLPARHDTVRIPVTGTPRPARQVLTAVRAGSSGRAPVAAGLEALGWVCQHDLPELADPDAA